MLFIIRARALCRILPVFFSLVVVAPAWAGAIARPSLLHWIGSFDTRFSNPANWDSSRVPSRLDTALFDGSANRGCILDKDDTPSSIRFSGRFRYKFSFNNRTINATGPAIDLSGFKPVRGTSARLVLAAKKSFQTILVPVAGTIPIQALVIANDRGVICSLSVARSIHLPLHVSIDSLVLKRGAFIVTALPASSQLRLKVVGVGQRFKVSGADTGSIVESGAVLTADAFMAPRTTITLAYHGLGTPRPTVALLAQRDSPLPKKAIDQPSPPAFSSMSRSTANDSLGLLPKAGARQKDTTLVTVFAPGDSAAARSKPRPDSTVDSAGARRVRDLLATRDSVLSSAAGRTIARVEFCCRPGMSCDTALLFANSGTDTILIVNRLANHTGFNVNADSIVVAPDSLVRDTIRYAPLAAGVDSMVVYRKYGTRLDSLVITGSVKAGRLRLSADTLTWRQPALGRSVRLMFKRKNVGTDTLAPGRFRLLGDSAMVADSAAAVLPMRALAPGDSSVDTVVLLSARLTKDTVLLEAQSAGGAVLDTLVIVAVRSSGAVVPAVTARSVQDYSFGASMLSNRSVLFSYTIPVFCSVKLEVCNVIGQALEMPFSGLKDAGMHEVSWEGLALSKGIYFCRFKALDAIKGDVKFAKTVRVIF